MMRIRAVGSTSSLMVRRFSLITCEDTKEKTINGKKYAFDQNGAMVAEWSMDETKVATADMPATPGKASNC